MTQTLFEGAGARSLEAVYQTPDLVAQRAWTLDQLRPQPGEHILDIGAGPGLLAYDLARLVGEGGRVVGTDISTDMLELARGRLAAQSHAECVEADAAALPLPDAAFDAAVSTQVYEYVADMPRALAELHRVLRPGGRALIVDTDWRSLVWHCGDKALMERALSCWDDHLVDPHLPATLGPLLTDAGFTVRRVEVFALLSTSWQPASYAAGIVGSIRQFVQRNGARHGLSDAEIAAWNADQQRVIDAGQFFFSLNRYLFLATR